MKQEIIVGHYGLSRSGAHVYRFPKNLCSNCIDFTRAYNIFVEADKFEQRRAELLARPVNTEGEESQST